MSEKLRQQRSQEMVLLYIRWHLLARSDASLLYACWRPVPFPQLRKTQKVWRSHVPHHGHAVHILSSNSHNVCMWRWGRTCNCSVQVGQKPRNQKMHIAPCPPQNPAQVCPEVHPQCWMFFLGSPPLWAAVWFDFHCCRPQSVIAPPELWHNCLNDDDPPLGQLSACSVENTEPQTSGMAGVVVSSCISIPKWTFREGEAPFSLPRSIALCSFIGSDSRSLDASSDRALLSTFTCHLRSFVHGWCL